MEDGRRLGGRKKAVWLSLCVLAAASVVIAIIYYLSGSEATESPPEPPASPAGQSGSQPPATPAGQISGVYANADELAVSEVVSGLDIPWGVAFTPDGALLVNQRSGGLIARTADGVQRTVEADFGDLEARGELGLMGMAVDPGFVANRRFYTCQGEREQRPDRRWSPGE